MSKKQNAGYSETPLAKKLSLKDGMQVWFDGMPDSVRAEIDTYGLILEERNAPYQGLNAAHIFVKERSDGTASRNAPHVDRSGGSGLGQLAEKASKVATDITEDTIRSVCLPMGFVDIKVCAVDAIWSGLKLTIRKELR